MRRLRAGTDHATANGPVVAATLGPLTPTTGKTRMRKAELAVYPRLVHRGSHRGPLRWRKSLPLLLVSGVVHDGQCRIHPNDDSKLANSPSTSLLCPADLLALAVAGLTDLALAQHWASGGTRPTVAEIPALVLTVLVAPRRTGNDP
jgi:hypothetical protein